MLFNRKPPFFQSQTTAAIKSMMIISLVRIWSTTHHENLRVASHLKSSDIAIRSQTPIQTFISSASSRNNSRTYSMSVPNHQRVASAPASIKPPITTTSRSQSSRCQNHSLQSRPRCKIASSPSTVSPSAISSRANSRRGKMLGRNRATNKAKGRGDLTRMGSV